MQGEPGRNRRPWWMHVLLSPWYVIGSLWGLGELAEGIYWLIFILAVLAFVTYLSASSVWNSLS